MNEKIVRVDFRGPRTNSLAWILGALSLGSFGCGAAAPEEDDVETITEAVTSTNVTGAIPPAVTNQENGTQYSVALLDSSNNEICSAGVINSWYLVTAAHCQLPATIKIARAGAATLTNGVLGNAVIGAQTYPIVEHKLNGFSANPGPWNDVKLLEITGPVGIDSCQWTSCGVSQPINQRMALGPRKIYGNQGQDVLEIFGWGFGQNNGNDNGSRGVQRHGTLHIASQNFGATDSFPVTGGNPIPRSGGYISYDGKSGYYPCTGDSGSPLLHFLLGTAWITYGINRDGATQVSCSAGGVSQVATGGANQQIDSSMVQLIFQLERQKGFTTANDPNSGRFKCKIMNNLDGAGEDIRYWICDNGQRFPSWSPGFTKTPSNPYTLNFNTVQDIDDFVFLTATPNLHGPANWSWVNQAGNGVLSETTDVMGDTGTIGATGTDAILWSVHFRDGYSHVKVNSTDTGYAGLYVRYVDESHHYRFVYGTWACGIYKRDGNNYTQLAPCSVAPNFNNVSLDFTATGDTLTGSVNGATVVTATDTTFKFGRTGIYKRALLNTTFDEYQVKIN